VRFISFAVDSGSGQALFGASARISPGPPSSSRTALFRPRSRGGHDLIAAVDRDCGTRAEK
jgi:hypothetical protein